MKDKIVSVDCICNWEIKKLRKLVSRLVNISSKIKDMESDLTDVYLHLEDIAKANEPYYRKNFETDDSGEEHKIID